MDSAGPSPLGSSVLASMTVRDRCPDIFYIELPGPHKKSAYFANVLNRMTQGFVPPATFPPAHGERGRYEDMIGRAIVGCLAVGLLVVAGLSEHHHHLWLGAMLATVGIASLVVVSTNGLDAD